MNQVTKISGLSKVLMILASLLLLGSLFAPLWKIELFAPQYPEGLVLYINADGLTGNVDIINGLNHYIGMATLHDENFIEFSILTYIIAGIALCILIGALTGRRRVLYFLLAGFMLFGIVAMADFYRWNYNYGHNLDPSAAIKVPGMSYQPPLIGFKQLLNFGAYSIPAFGGVLFIASGVLLLLATLWERGVFSRWMKKKPIAAVTVLFCGMFLSASCGQTGPMPVKINKDMCAYCKMTITSAPFAAQLITPKGRQYAFDDLECLIAYVKENENAKGSALYVADFCSPQSFLDVQVAKLMHSDSLRSPMRGNIAAFSSNDSMQVYLTRFQAREVYWDLLNK